jgi:6-phosphofructokinase
MALVRRVYDESKVHSRVNATEFFMHSHAHPNMICALFFKPLFQPRPGIVKVMGRHAGFLAAHSALAAGKVDLVLIPEVAFELRGANGILPHIERALQRNGHCLIVLAEGAGTHLLPSTDEKDPSGNKVLPDNGSFLKTEITRFFKERNTTVKIAYNDPSYMIRSVAANSADQVYCIILAQNAVHGAMAGYTGAARGDLLLSHSVPGGWCLPRDSN